MLDMDHVYVKFADFLWAYTFIGPFSFLLWKKGTIFLRIRKWLQKLGLIDPQSMCDYEALAATLCLEQSQVIHYCAQTEGREGDSQTGNVAGTFHFLFSLLSISLSHSEPLIGFFFPDFPSIDGNFNFQIAHLFVVSIDLVTKRFMKAKLDDQVLNAKEATILLWYNTGE